MAGLPMEIKSRYEYCRWFCRDYLTDREPVFSAYAEDDRLAAMREYSPDMRDAKPVQQPVPEYFLHWLRSQELTPKELVDILRLCQEEDYLTVMQQAPCHTEPTEIQDTVMVQAVDLHLYDAFIQGKEGAAV